MASKKSPPASAPVYSMTGYASAQYAAAQAEGEVPATAAPVGASAARLGLEIRAVNSRFLDLSFRLPEELRAQEPALRALLTARLRRGKVELRAAIETDVAASVAMPGIALLQRLGAVQEQVRTWLPDAAPLNVADVLHLSSQSRSGAVAQAQDWTAIVADLAAQAVDTLLLARRNEGERLVVMLRERLQQLRDLAAQATPLVPQLVRQQRQRFLDRWHEALGSTAGTMGDAAATIAAQAAQERALSEATAFAIRIDVAEEITRLTAHLDEIAQLLDRGGEIGKRLDFLIQELHREANTLGSKSATLELTRISVDMKVLIEQMREQVQNIE